MPSNIDLLDRAFYSVITRMVETGNAPSRADLAAELDLDSVDIPTVLNDLFAAGHAGWLDDNGEIVSFAPFYNVPNQYKISVDGQQKWFGQ
jgi:hypothetical protein